MRQSYNRFQDFQTLQQLLIIDRNKLGVSIARSMTNFIRNRCHVLFFCTSLNSAQTVQDNIISMFTMCAKRMHIHIHSTNFSRLYRNRPFMASVIFNCIRYGAWQVCSTLSRRRKLDLTASDENTQYLLDDSLPVRYDEVTTICI